MKGSPHSEAKKYGWKRSLTSRYKCCSPQANIYYYSVAKDSTRGKTTILYSIIMSIYANKNYKC